MARAVSWLALFLVCDARVHDKPRNGFYRGFKKISPAVGSVCGRLRHGVLSEWTLLLTTGIAAVHLWSYIVGVRLFGLLPFVADSLHAEADREPHEAVRLR